MNIIFSPLIASADSCSFFFLSIYLSFFPPFFDLHVIHLIYQVKGISGHQWVCVGCVRVCLGVSRCVRVYLGMRGCAQVCGDVPRCVFVCMGVRWVGVGVGESAWVCTIVHECVRLCAGVRRFAPGYACLCGMNFQNFFQRIESLHQRTLIRILQCQPKQTVIFEIVIMPPKLHSIIKSS